MDGFRFDLASILTRAHSAWHPTKYDDKGNVIPPQAAGAIVDAATGARPAYVLERLFLHRSAGRDTISPLAQRVCACVLPAHSRPHDQRVGRSHGHAHGRPAAD